MSDQGTILYPNNFLKIPVNINDRIAVSYTTKWPSTNLTVLCRAATAQLFSFYNMPDNPILASGVYLTPDFRTMNVSIAQYPAECAFRLTKYGQSGGEVDSTSFTLVSSADASPRTFAISSTIGLSTSTSATSTATSISTSSTSSATTTSGTTGSQIPQRTGSEQSPTSSPSSSGGLPKTTSIAIGVAVGLGVLLIATIAAFWFMYSKRKKERRQPTSPSDQSESESRFQKQELEGRSLQHPALKSDKHKYSTLPQRVEIDGSAVGSELEGSQSSFSRHASPVPQYETGHPAKRMFRQLGSQRHELA